MPTLIQTPSPNFDTRAIGVKLTYIVLHYTGMKTGAEALSRLTDPASKVSAHYLIEEDGRIFALVDEAKRAWHAGVSFWRGESDINSASIGIELVNPGHLHGYRPFPAKQIAALKELMHDIVKRHGMDPRRAVLAHADVAPGRKEDPGELFPWQELAEAGLGFWPQPETGDYGHASDSEVQRFLRRIGYDCPDSDAYDLPTRNALIAFQRHFEPNNFTGTPERETIARMRALLRMMG
jgi:N-acetylmuramoyl-L-alanine amidase